MQFSKEEIYQKIANKEMPWEEALRYLEQFHKQRKDTRHTYPLSEGQKALWVIYQFAPHSYAYNLPVALWINCKTDISALKRSFERLFDNHPSLRAVVRLKDGEPVQMIPESQDVCFNQEDLSGLSDSDIQRIVKEQARKPFNLETGPLQRITLFTRSDGDYILLINFHHIISDGVSIGHFLKELYQCYLSEKSGMTYSFPKRKATYADFVDWQKKMLESDDGQRHRDYWLKVLSKDLSILELPLDKPRPVIPSYQGSTYTIETNETLTQALRDLAYSNSTTTFTVMLGALKVLLYRYSHHEDILVGTPIAGRPETRFEEVIGYFMNMVVVRTDLSGDPTFQGLLEQVNETILGALEHGDYPFFTLAKELGRAQKESDLPFFQVAFYFQNWINDLGKESDRPGKGRSVEESFILESFQGIHQEGEFDLTLEVFEQEKKMILSFKYNSDIFEEATIRRIAGHYLQILQDVGKTPDKRISKIALLTKEEEDQLLVEFNDTYLGYPQEKCMHQLFEEQARQTPESIAVTCEDKALSYGELNARASQLAVYLQLKGVKPGTLVGIFMERSIEMLIGLLGILKAGGAYVPFDPIYPAERLYYMMQDTNLPMIITQSFIKNKLPDYKVEIIQLDRDWDHIVGANAEGRGKKELHPSDKKVTPEDLAYVIYTSGSTGKPKGVQILHRSLTNLLWSMGKYPGCTAQDRLLALTTICFDIAALELFLPLITGGQVEILPTDMVNDGLKLLERIEKSDGTIIQATPATWQMLLNAGWKGSKSLKILCGGEALNKELAQKLLQRGKEVWNLYGPTETAIWSAVWQVKSGERILIGRPIANTQFYVLDSYFNLVPIGVAGELHIGGHGLAKGYLNKPNQTKERFVFNPFEKSGSPRIYKTGDLVRYFPDGSIEYLGRIDSQVKLRGFRIELGEIEAVLLGCPSVMEAVVIAIEDKPGRRQLVAYIVPKKSQEITISEIRSFLMEKLPAYMVPSAFVVLEALPLTLNGKVDRRSLPLPDESRLDVGESFVAPRSTIELQLVQIWEDILEVHPVGVWNNFFDLGGNSLLAVRLMIQIQKQFGKNVPMKTIVESPTIAQFAQFVRDEKMREPFTPLVCIQPSGENLPFFCISPADGTVFRFTELAYQLGKNQPFYALQAYGLEPGTTPFLSYKDMAEKYIEALRVVFPQGPYIIGGFSLGGGVAYEMAQQLQRQGERMALLVLFDTLAPPVYRSFTEDNDTQHFVGFTREFGGSHNANLLRLYLEKRKIDIDKDIERVVYEDAQSLPHQEKLNVLWDCVQRAGILSPDVGIEYLDRILRVYTTSFSAALKYTPEPYLGHHIILLRADNGFRKDIEDLSLYWEIYAPGSMSVVDVPGNHFSMLSLPHVKTVAKRLRECIEQVQVSD